MIDPHVHFRDWNQKEKETVAHGLTVAKALGFTGVFDMPNTDPPLTSRENIEKRFRLAEGVDGINYHLWAGLTANPKQIESMVEVYNDLFPKVVGMKMFLGNSTGDMGIVDFRDQVEVFRTLKSCGYEGFVAVHAEKQSLIKPELYIPGRFETHSLARPAEAEIQSVRDALDAVRQSGFNGLLHVCHVSTAGAIKLIEDARAKGMGVTFGVTPHHALYTSEDAKDHDRFLKMNPPLRDGENRRAVFESLLNGSATWIESDHAPHTREQKENGASGIPGLERYVELVKVLKESGISEQRLYNLTEGNAAALLTKSLRFV